MGRILLEDLSGAILLETGMDYLLKDPVDQPVALDVVVDVGTALTITAAASGGGSPQSATLDAVVEVGTAAGVTAAAGLATVALGVAVETGTALAPTVSAGAASVVLASAVESGTDIAATAVTAAVESNVSNGFLRMSPPAGKHWLK